LASGHADDLGRLAVWVPCGDALTEGFQAPHLRLDLELSRLCSGQVLMLSGLSFEGHGAFPAQC
jgi:hypothetical protein